MSSLYFSSGWVNWSSNNKGLNYINFRAQKELVEKERKEEDEARKKRLGHADDVRAQIREKEHARIAERNAFFEEGVKLDEEARQRRLKLEEVKRKKLETLRWVMGFTPTFRVTFTSTFRVAYTPLFQGCHVT